MAYMKDTTGRRLDTFKVAGADDTARTLGDNSLCFYGDSISDMWQLVSTGTPAVTYSQGISYGRQMQMYARNRFKVTSEYGVAGESTTQILARAATVIADPARNVFLYAGINSVAGANPEPAADIINSNRAIWDALQNAGKRVIQPTIMPARQIITTAQRQIFDQVNAWIMAEGPKRGVVVIPWHHLWADVTDGKPHGPSQTAPWTTIDGTHPSSYGAALMGKYAAEFLAPLFPGNGNQLTCTNADSSNAILNGMMLTAGGNGTLNGASSALVPFGWKVTTTGDLAVTASIIPSTDNLGNWQQLKITAGTVNTGSVQFSYDASTSPAWAVGDTVIARLEVDTDTDFVNTSKFELDMVALTTGFATLGTARALQNTSATQDIHRVPITNGVIETPPLLIPATTGIIQFKLVFAGLNGINGTTSTIRVRRAGIHRVPTP